MATGRSNVTGAAGMLDLTAVSGDVVTIPDTDGTGGAAAPPPVIDLRSAGRTPVATTTARMSGISRRFGSTVALDNVDFDVRQGEIHALLGENGAGKTTLMRILAGLDRPDTGSVHMGGSQVNRFDPRALRDIGVSIVQQHFTLVPTLTAAENLVLARPEGRLLPGAKAATQRVTALSERYSLQVRPDVAAGQLSVGEQQRLELLRALDADAKLLVLDEPTAVLTDQEATALLAVCRRLAEEGRSVVIITHRLAEVFAGCDRVTVLRGGRVVLAGAEVSSQTREGLATAMVGAAATGEYDRRSEADSFVANPSAVPRLAVSGLTHGRLVDAHLEVAAGEVLGVAGVDGNGQADLEAVLSGRSPTAVGTIELDGERMEITDPRARVRARIAYIPSDRYRWALARGMTLADCLELGRGARWRPHRRRRHGDASPSLSHWDVRSAGAGARAGSLSGGNAQKLVLAREMASEPNVVLACYPTRGLDPEAARTVVGRVLGAATAGAAVVWMGAELDELLAVADRIVVASGGKLVGPFLPPYDRAAIGLAMAGGH